MLFHLFCMFHHYWRIKHRSQDSAGKSTVRMQYFGRSTIDGNIPKLLFFRMMEPAKRGGRGGPPWPPPIGRRGHQAWHAAMWGGGPRPPSAIALSRTSSPENPKVRGIIEDRHSRLCGAENTREKRALRQAEICRGKFPPGGGNRRHRHRHRAGLHWDHHHHLHHRHHHVHRCTSSPL